MGGRTSDAPNIGRRPRGTMPVSYAISAYFISNVRRRNALKIGRLEALAGDDRGNVREAVPV